MSDLSALSNEDLLKMYQQRTANAPQSGGLSNLSDAQLLEMYRARAAPPAAPTPPGDPVARVVGSGIRGVNQALYGAPAALLDAAALPFEGSAALTNALGLSSGPSAVGETLRAGAKGLRAAPDAIANAGGAALGIAPQDFEPKTRAEKVAGKVGEYTGNVLATLLPATAVARYAQPGTVTQGVARTLASQPGAQLASGIVGGAVEGDTDSAIAGTAAQLATPLAISGFRRALTPVGNRLSNQEQRLIASAQAENIPLTPAQATGNPTLRTAEATMATLPLASGPMERTFRGQREAFNRAVISRTGVDADAADTDTVDRIFRTVGARFDNLGAQTTLNADINLAKDIANVAQGPARFLDRNTRGIFAAHMEEFRPMLQALTQRRNSPITMTGEQYARMRENIGIDIRAHSENPRLQQALHGLQKALDNAVKRSTSGSLRDAWREARSQYSAAMVIDKAMRGGTQADRVAGNIPYSGLKQAVQQSDPRGFSRGRGPLNELARIGEYLSNKVPDSGTVPRGQMLNLLTGGVLFGGGTMGVGLAAGAAAAATPWAVSRLYNTPMMHRYLTNQAVQPTNLQGLYGAQAVQGLLSP